MKELSLIEKADAYDRVSKEVRDFFEGKTKMCSDVTKALEDLFPELKESEDEKIRKWIINEIKINHHNLDEDNVDFVDKAIAWIEKQGEPNPDYCHHDVDLSNRSDEYRKAYYDGWNNCNIQHSQCQSENNDALKCLINGMKFYYEDNDEATWGTGKFSMKVKDILSWLEKQGEPNPYSGTSFEYNGHTWGMCARDGGVEIGCDRNLKAFLSSEKSIIYPNNHSQESTAPESVIEAVKEEGVNNGAKEDKPKFKIGDWIVNPKGEALHITDIKDSCYIFNNDESHFWITCYCDQQCHLWTINDAKDGDVLQLGNVTAIFKKFIGNKKCYCYCSVWDGKFEIPTQSDSYGCYIATPATREQRDLLFQKMEKEGYRWNSFDNKVVKL